MVFDVWRDMFMVRVGFGQGWVIRMLLGIVPIELLLTLPHFITIIHNAPRARSKRKFLTHHQAVMVNFYIAHQYGNGRTPANNCQWRTPDDRVVLRQHVNNLLVLKKQLQGIHDGLSGRLSLK